MSRTFPVGTEQVALVLTVNDEGPVAGLTPTARILAPLTGFGFDFDDDTFKAIGSIVTPTVTLAPTTTSGVYAAVWNTENVQADADVVVVYEHGAPSPFIEDEQIVFESNQTDFVSSFVEAAFDATNRTLTVVTGIKNAFAGILAPSAVTITIKDELDNTLFAKSLSSATGVHRAVFPSVSNLVPNRVLLIYLVFTVGASTYSTVETITVLGSKGAA